MCLNLKQRILGLIKEKLKRQENVIFADASIPKGGNRMTFILVLEAQCTIKSCACRVS